MPYETHFLFYSYYYFFYYTGTFHEYEGNRIFQTALGYTPEMYRDEFFRSHLAGAINWAAGKDKFEK